MRTFFQCFLDSIQPINFENYNLNREKLLEFCSNYFLKCLMNRGTPVVRDKCLNDLYYFDGDEYKKLKEKDLRIILIKFAHKLGIDELYGYEVDELRDNLDYDFITCGCNLEAFYEDARVRLKQLLAEGNKRYFSKISDFKLWYLPKTLTARLKDNRSYKEDGYWHIYPVMEDVLASKPKSNEDSYPIYYYVCPFCGMIHGHGYTLPDLELNHGELRYSHCNSDFRMESYCIHAPLDRDIFTIKQTKVTKKPCQYKRRKKNPSSQQLIPSP